MTLRPDSRSRARTRIGIRTTRRLSPCYRHPNEPITGICASCLRDRLSGLDTSAAPTAASPELRRCRSVVSISKCEASSSGLSEPRRRSCDVVSSDGGGGGGGGGSLSTLFDVDDLKSGSETEARVESKNVGLSRVTYTVIESKKQNQDEVVRVSSNKLGVLDADCVYSDGEGEDGEFKTMKEYIDLEFPNKTKKSKDLKEIAGNFWGAASIFSKKLRKWREKNSKMKKHSDSSNGKSGVGDDGDLKSFEDRRKLGERHSEIVGRRRSCDTEPRFSVDGGRISFEEPRASWDGYMIARTIPRLAPMFSVVENGILGNVNSRFENRRLSVDGGQQMHSIIEDESSSGASGNSDSSSSMRQSSSDRSSSVHSFAKKLTSSENVKLVITEKELKDWHLGCGVNDGLESFGSVSRNTPPIESVGNLNVQAKKSVRWRKVCNVFGLKVKNGGENVIEPCIDENCEKKQTEEAVKEIGGWNLARSSSVVGSRASCDDAIRSSYGRRSVDNAYNAFRGMEDSKLGRNQSTKYSSAGLDDGVTPFYMTPLRGLRNSKSGKFKLQNSHSVVGNILQLN
ncbi:PREDICTED: UPF0503 protein At3g09070, chloroplastic [Erythranthe guttata]|uniref:UPF0503 protein At3g09070, chloroplastic n=1 Tax=Erythranthe guttata TaxID=4155 RepID=UPI00064DA4F3|nr:PREDICTED: UPF0503 protein At3g09070, chloroplastic [Erythranthe guttata]|eukprot:XP_012839589.1 PREDICTED: UPF0503 protein At3g09070, chloroplastic [Erythranthe guttata]